MALIKCPECSKDVSSVAQTCPHCGFPLEEIENTSNRPETGSKEDAEEIRINGVRCYDGDRLGSTVFGSKVGSIICMPEEKFLAFVSSGKSGFLSKLTLGPLGGLLLTNIQSKKLNIQDIEEEGGFLVPFCDIEAVEARNKGILGMSKYLYVRYKDRQGSTIEKSMMTTSALGGGDFELIQEIFRKAD